MKPSRPGFADTDPGCRGLGEWREGATVVLDLDLAAQSSADVAPPMPLRQRRRSGRAAYRPQRPPDGLNDHPAMLGSVAARRGLRRRSARRPGKARTSTWPVFGAEHPFALTISISATICAISATSLSLLPRRPAPWPDAACASRSGASGRTPRSVAATATAWSTRSRSRVAAVSARRIGRVTGEQRRQGDRRRTNTLRATPARTTAISGPMPSTVTPGPVRPPASGWRGAARSAACISR